MERKYDFKKGCWDYFNPVEVVFGRGCRHKLTDRLLGLSLLIVTTRRGRRQFTEDAALKTILSSNLITWVDNVRENPGLDDLQIIVNSLEGIKLDAIIAFGGGSAIDAAKIINVALTSGCLGNDLFQLLDQPALHANANPLKLYAVPTTSGTGSEVTPFATLWDYRNKRKMSLAGRAVWPTVAFVDAALADSLPIESTLTTGLDAINQAAESIWNKNANPITMAYAQRALRLGFESLPRLMNGAASELDRDKMAEASLLAGLAISQTRTALCHSISYPLTAHFNVPHGLACAFTMTSVLKCNLQKEDGRFERLAVYLTGRSDLDDLICCFEKLQSDVQISKNFKKYVSSVEDLFALESQMLTPGRSDNNLAEVDNVRDILVDSWNAV